jgi:AmmeMemoRadiSam system protein B
VNQCGIVDIDKNAHTGEHSIEVQLPFLQYIYGSSFKFLPICFLMQDLETCTEVGETLASVLKNKNAVIIASTDLTHYEPQSVVVEKDMKAIEAILGLDAKRFFSVLRSYNVSACGYGPVAALITAAKKAGIEKAELLSHKTSGDVTGDTSAVVGYAAIAFEKKPIVKVQSDRVPNAS